MMSVLNWVSANPEAATLGAIILTVFVCMVLQGIAKCLREIFRFKR